MKIQSKLAHRFNPKTGEFIENVLVYENENGEFNLEEDCTLEPLPYPVFTPIFDLKKKVWKEGKSKKEIAKLEEEANAPIVEEKSEVEKLRAELDEMKALLKSLSNS